MKCLILTEDSALAASALALLMASEAILADREAAAEVGVGLGFESARAEASDEDGLAAPSPRGEVGEGDI
jgi:hypothetical protein